jgi:mRNA-degrading endonuclease YafQ of YafQ-DinJ toxin-antitoxin module
MKVLQTRIFSRRVKKIHKDEKVLLDQAVRKIMEEPTIGMMKKGDLVGAYVYKYKHLSNETLLAYQYDDELKQLTLLALGSHENLYHDLKR